MLLAVSNLSAKFGEINGNHFCFHILGFFDFLRSLLELGLRTADENNVQTPASKFYGGETR